MQKSNLQNQFKLAVNRNEYVKMASLKIITSPCSIKFNHCTGIFPKLRVTSDLFQEYRQEIEPY
jgi:hypothetical protein